MPSDRMLSRRAALGAFGGAGLSGLVAACGGSSSSSPGAVETADAAASCVLTPEVTEGPYWIDDALTRRDIREDRGGLPLVLTFAVQSARSCKAIAGADVEIWHCDADGVYSGFEEASRNAGMGAGGGAQDDTRYLRGHQKAGRDGRATFVTIFPGWYRGRTPHIHLKVHVGGDVVHTGQVFFDERTTARVYRQRPYSAHGAPDTSHAEDGIYADAGGSRAVVRLRSRAEGQRGYRGAITLGVAT